MITCKLGIFAETVIRDAESNRLSIINMMEEVKTPTFPVLLHKLACLFLLVREPTDESTQAFSLRLMHGTNEFTRGPLTVDFQSGLFTRAIATFMGVPIPEPGQLRCELLRGEQVVASAVLPIGQIATQTAVQA